MKDQGRYPHPDLILSKVESLESIKKGALMTNPNEKFSLKAKPLLKQV